MVGKKCVLVRLLLTVAGNFANVAGESEFPLDYSPGMRRSSAPVGGDVRRRAVAAAPRYSVRPPWIAPGNLAAEHDMRMLKKMPMLNGLPAFWKVARIPEPTPRYSLGRAFMIAAVLGEANTPNAAPIKKEHERKRQDSRNRPGRRSQDKPNPSPTMPPVLMPRGPIRSDSQPPASPKIMKPTSKRQDIDSRPERRILKLVAVQRQPDALQPYDQRTGSRHKPARSRAAPATHAERSQRNRCMSNNGSFDAVLNHHEQHQQQAPPTIRRSPAGCPSLCVAPP